MDVMTTLAEELERGTVVLDGGLATQLEATGHDLSDDLWSARLLRDDPEAIVAAHLAFLRAGASVVTTASYQATIAGFARHGVDGVVALRSSVALAREACERAGVDRPLWVAASVGPYGAMLADGSEYRGNYGLSVRELVRFHRDRMRILADAGPDLLALETVPDAVEAEALLTCLDGLGIPAWLSFTIADFRTRAGQPLAEAFGLAKGVDAVVAVGVNCCDPADVAPALRIATEVTGKPAVAYPNSGEGWDAEARQWTGAPAPIAEHAEAWRAAGARLIGGCCRVTPADIAQIAAHLRA